MNDNHGLLEYSEEGSEASHKKIKHVREHGSRKMSVEVNFKDTTRKLWFMSDPLIRGMKRRLTCSNCMNLGHTIRSCPDLKDKGQNPDEKLLNSLICQDDDATERILETQGAEIRDLGDIFEEDESQEMETN